jgi:hydroxymethylglutaryl-CoA reductase (NADPH)
VCLSVAGNFDIDKKPAWLNILLGRGLSVWAEVTLPEAVITSVLKTTAKEMYDVWVSKNMIGSVMSGSMSFNSHAANVVAALFAATGQDLAHVVETSIATTTVDVVGKNLVCSVYLPDVMVGTVGGGTGLPTQGEALKILGVSGGNNGKNADTFAEIIGGVVLAGEISLLASLSEGSLAKSHEKLARGVLERTNGKSANKQICK